VSERVAIIGSGMAGLAAGWMCRRAGHAVTIFEAQGRRGMDAHSLPTPGPRGAGNVDVPLRVMSPHAWQSVLALCAEVGVETFEVDTCASFTWIGGPTWLRNGKLRLGPWALPTLGSLRFLNRETATVALGLARLALDGRRDLGDQTLGEYAERRRLPSVFFRGFLLPLLTTVCTCDEETLLGWPAGELLALFEKILHGKALRRLRGGSPALVDRLVEGLEVRSPERVVNVAAGEDEVTVGTASGWSGAFDRVLVATQANHAVAFLSGDGLSRERAILARFPYDTGELVVHRDRRFLPPREADWTPLNYLVARDLSRSMFTVWVNPIEPSITPPGQGRDEAMILQTWNPLFEPDPATVVTRIAMERAVVDRGNAAAHADLSRLHDEPGRRIYFCGSWAASGVPLLESAVRSAMAVVRRLGVDVAWDPIASEG